MTTIPQSSAAAVSRTKEFFKVFFLPLLFTLPGFIAYPFFEHYDSVHLKPNAGSEAYPIGAVFAIIGSAVLIVRWWARSRWRAYGVIAGFFAIPPILVGMFVMYILFSNTSLYPH